MTGTFPGFARPHFAPANLQHQSSSANTVYVQYVLDERIVAFDPLEQDLACHVIPLADSSAVRVGDSAVYAYAFAPNDAVVGARDVVAHVIAQRFDEIVEKEFAACTAAQFARLEDRLPDLYLRAFRSLAELDSASSRLWRDSVIFQTTLRDELLSLQIPPDCARLQSHEKDGRLEVVLSLTLEHPRDIQPRRLETACRRLLQGTGLFGQNDVFTLSVETAAGDATFGQLRMLESGELDDILKEAQFFLEEKVFLPALRSGSQRTLNVVRNTRQWISKFQKIGDLIRYMDRFRPEVQQQTSFSFAQIKQIRFEDVYAEFIEKYGRYRGFQTTITDFEEGAAYSPFTLSIYTRTYDNRAGGIRSVGKVGKHEAVVVNITLSGGKYANEWLKEGKRLKCYLKSLPKQSEASDEGADANRSIMRYPHVPILVFTRKSGESDFIYQGIFQYVQITADDKGSKWFDLVKTDTIA